MKNKILGVIILTLLVSCEATVTSKTESPAPAPVPVKKIFSCDDNSNVYHQWKNIGDWTISGLLAITTIIDLRSATVDANTVNNVDWTFNAGVGGCSYVINLLGNGCSGTYKFTNPVLVTGGGLDCSPMLETVGGTYMVTEDTLSLCNNASACVNYTKKEE